jgi:hypothetical protein
MPLPDRAVATKTPRPDPLREREVQAEMRAERKAQAKARRPLPRGSDKPKPPDHRPAKAKRPLDPKPDKPDKPDKPKGTPHG